MKKGYTHFTIYEREKILQYRSEGCSYREIGRRLERSHTSVIDEIKRNSFDNEYSPQKATTQYEKRRSSK